MTTLADLRGEIYDITDNSGSVFFNDYDVNKYINKSLAKLQGIMVNTYDASYFIQTGSYDITTVANQQDYDISSLNPYKVVTVSINDGSYDWIMENASINDRHDYQLSLPIELKGTSSPYRYTLFGNVLKAIPAPPASYTIKVWHIPQWSDLSADADVVNVQIPTSFLDWVIYDVGIKMKIKSEEPIQELSMLKQDVERLIREDAENRITKQVRYAPNVDNDLGRIWYYKDLT